jgi:hypothetical protein
VGPPLKSQGSSNLDSLQAVGYYKIMKVIKIKLTKKDIKEIHDAEKYLVSVKSNLLENLLGKIIFQLHAKKRS